MDIGKLFLSLGIKTDTKDLEETIKKIEELKKQSQELNKVLKETGKINKDGSGKSRKSSDPELDELKRETKFKIEENKQARESLKTKKEAIKTKAEVLKADKVSAQIEVETTKKKLVEAKTESEILKKELLIKKGEEKSIKEAEKKKEKEEKDRKKEQEGEEKKKEKEQKQREKDREKSTKNFFKQIDNGFGFIAKAFTGSLIGAGIAGAITAQTARSTTLSNMFKQYNLDPEKGQRWANVFRIGSSGAISNKEAGEVIKSLKSTLTSSELGEDMIGRLSALGLDSSLIRDPFAVLQAMREKAPLHGREYFTELAGRLGIPPIMSQALNPENFNEEQFQDAYTRPILSQLTIDANARINTQISDLGDAFDRLRSKLVSDFEPEIENIITKIRGLLTPENVKKGKDVAKTAGAAFLLRQGIKHPFLSASALGYYIANKITDGRAMDGLGMMMSHPVESFTEAGKLLKGKFTGKYKYGDFPYYKFNQKEIEDLERQYNNGKIYDPENPLFQQPRNDWIRQNEDMANTGLVSSLNLNVNTNINTNSIDNTTIPIISEKIGDEVSSAVQGYNSRYTNLSYPV
jgi:hypothetical protein